MFSRRHCSLAAQVPLILICGFFSGCSSDQDDSDLLPPEQLNAGSVESVPTPANQSVAGAPQGGADSDLQQPATSVETKATPPFAGGNNSAPTPRTLDLDTATAAQLKEVALQALDLGQDDVAFKLVRKALRREPENPEIIYFHAMILAERHRFHEAIQILDELAEKVPQSKLPVLGQTAEWMVEAGQFSEAEDRYRQILAIFPNEQRVHQFLGQLLLQLGRRAEATSHLRYLMTVGALNQEELRALLLGRHAFPGDDTSGRLVPLDDLAKARQAIGDEKPERALELLQQSDQPLAKSLRARIQTQRQEWDAVRDWLATFDDSTADVDGQFAKARLRLEEGQVDQALRAVAQTILLDPTDAEAYDLLASAAEQANQPDVSQRASDRAKQLRKTVEVGQQVIGDSEKNRDLVAQLIVLLQQLQRPLEVFGWKSVDLVYAMQAGRLTDTQAKQQFDEISRQREQFLQSQKQQINQDFLLCGLRLKTP
ncbi:tetratricopeptide repeat protein [Rubripirellula sp.]|nr:tetratricopeptide repeat protein [Rubripirellula sp.]